MRKEPEIKRAVAFLDGQNLFYGVKEAFGYRYPNFHPGALVRAICELKGWQPAIIRFYTGIPILEIKPFWHKFWTAKLSSMNREGIITFSRPLRYRHQSIPLADGTETTALVGQEKGIDVRIALDIVRLAAENAYDVALIFSQDQDLSEAVDEVRKISTSQDRWIKAVSAFPRSVLSHNTRGINGTDWFPIERELYDACLDSRDFRPKEAGDGSKVV
jgi:uncharacterized LabA/DUF88 family protein